jgi:hypothetical protein
VLEYVWRDPDYALNWDSKYGSHQIPGNKKLYFTSGVEFGTNLRAQYDDY